ncbi:MAG: Beta sliding clamp [Chlamydiia bacterium]|nr:Beta sliding clamp [Chlamydiia bacterium]MCH9615584.1 Beta sliding clamp [Chlamydiia bacterium]MCH9629239.1 Beta sliding clamp [Chlamydiia bacterium]
MKVVLSRPELVSIIGKLQSIVSPKPAIPILANILLEAYDDQLVISATDLTVSMRAFIEAKVEVEGAVTLPARRFFQLIRELTTPELEIQCTTGELAYIHAGTSKFRLNGMHKSEFPALPDFSSANTFSVNGPKLKETLGKTVFAAAKEDSRHVLNGVLMRTVDGCATFVGTDGKRLAKVELPVDSLTDRGEYLIPLKAVEEMVKIMDQDELAKMSLFEDKIALDFGSVCLMTKLLTGQYPDVERVIPHSSQHKVNIHREELMTLLRQVSLFTTDKTHSVHFIFANGALHLVAASSEIGEGKVNMPVDFTGDELEIAFNPSFFLDILRHSQDETVSFSMTDSYNPGMLTDSSKAIFVIMPMRLNA